jgi:ATP synthase protein I
MVGLVVAVVSMFMVGAKGALAAAIGVLVVGVFFVIGTVAVAYASRVSPTMMMAAAMGTFFAKIFVLILVLTSLSDVTAWDPMVFSVTVILCTIAWTFGEARAFLKLRMLYVEPGSKVPGHYGEK